MKVVALTGRSGSGKSTVAETWKARGCMVIDADAVARLVVEPGSPTLEALAREFGRDILDESGALRRHELARRAFASKERTCRLTEITHPAIVAEIQNGIRSAEKEGRPLAVVDGAVIIGAPFEKFCDEFVVVTAPEEKAAARIAHRDGITEEQARARLAAQTPESVLCEKASYIIRNDGSPEDLRRAAARVLRGLTGEL